MDNLHVTWDDVARAGYLYLCSEERVERRGVHKTVEVPYDSRFLLDLDQNGRVLGVEFLSDVPISAIAGMAHRYATRMNGELIMDW